MGGMRSWPPRDAAALGLGNPGSLRALSFLLLALLCGQLPHTPLLSLACASRSSLQAPVKKVVKAPIKKGARPTYPVKYEINCSEPMGEQIFEMPGFVRPNLVLFSSLLFPSSKVAV